MQVHVLCVCVCVCVCARIKEDEKERKNVFYFESADLGFKGKKAPVEQKQSLDTPR
jgi:hypothetical protein